MASLLHIGIDDTDSPMGGCTTYIAALLVEELIEQGATFVDYPNLIRLNPNVPWKTRGNGALCLRITCKQSRRSAIKETVAQTVEENSDLGCEGTDPGIVFFSGKIPSEIKSFAKKTIQGLVKMEQALNLLKKFKAEAIGYGTGYGIVGAVAAIGETLSGDHTYEIIAYRTPDRRGTPRQLDPKSITDMDRRTRSETFNNIDPEKNRILITPRGPDPILYGIRGETADIVIQAHTMIRSLEPVERWVVFRTNQGTDAHLERVEAIDNIRPCHPVTVVGTVASPPKLIPKRHRVFSLEDKTGKADCAAYEPTGILRKISRHLIIGDKVKVAGGARPSFKGHALTINLEKLRILKLAPQLTIHNPRCPRCTKRMSSMGKDQGFRCSKCGLRAPDLQRMFTEEKRNISEGLFITSPRSQRHLTKPLARYGKERYCKPERMIERWHSS